MNTIISLSLICFLTFPCVNQGDCVPKQHIVKAYMDEMK